MSSTICWEPVSRVCRLKKGLFIDMIIKLSIPLLPNPAGKPEAELNYLPSPLVALLSEFMNQFTEITSSSAQHREGPDIHKMPIVFQMCSFRDV